MSLTERLRSVAVGDRLAAIAELHQRDRAEGSELGALVECLGHAEKAVQRGAADAFAALAAHGVPVEPTLRAALASPVARQRWGAAYAVSLLGDHPPLAVLPPLLESLGASDGDMRWAAAKIIVRLGDRPAVVEALRELLGAADPIGRKMALYCLRDLGVRAPAVEQAILRALADEERDVQLAAISTLVRLSTDRGEAAERLLEALAGGDERLCRAAAAGLGLLGERSESVLAALRAASASADGSLRRAATRALRQLGD